MEYNQNICFSLTFHISRYKAALAGICLFCHIEQKSSNPLVLAILETERTRKGAGGTLWYLFKSSSGRCYTTHVWLDKAGHVAKSKVFGAEMCNAFTRKWVGCPGKQHSIHHVHEQCYDLDGRPNTYCTLQTEILERAWARVIGLFKWRTTGDSAAWLFDCCFITQFSHICIPFLFPGDDGAQTNPENSSQENRIKARCRSCSSVLLKAVWGLLIILSVSSSWVGTTQIVKITYKNFYCPFFMTWFSTNWNIMFFPVYYSGHLATAQVKQSPMKKFR